MSFTHLHVASAFSAHYGTARPEVLAQAAAAQGAPAAAITDRDGLYGAVRHIRACLAAGIAPVVGVELTIEGETPGAITVIAHGRNSGLGWAGLVRLISAAHVPRKGAKPKAHGSANRAALLRRNHPAVLLDGEQGPVATVLLGPDSDVGQAVLAGDIGKAKALLGWWRGQGSVAVEIVCHHTQPGTSRSLAHAAAMWRLARETQTPAVLTNAARYLAPDDAVTGDVLDAAGLLLPLGSFTPQPNAQAWLKPPAAMEALAAQIAEHAGFGKLQVLDLLSQTRELSERCQLDPVADLAWRQPKVPELSLLGIDGDPQAVLLQRCRTALIERYPYAAQAELRRAEQRMHDELKTIAAFGFAGYFLTVADVSRLIRELGVRVQARGSGAGSLVNYLLRISNVDPLEHDLIFERFLGIQRSTLPDIDIDVEAARRHEIYRAIFARYGEHRVTLLSMQNAYRARGATRDAGLALGIPEESIGRIAGSLWRMNARDFRARLDNAPELRELAADVAGHPQLELLVDLTERLDRLPRHISMHPCGVILGNAGLLSVTPVQPSGMGLPMSQFDKDDIDDMGLLKLDVLGVRMQSAMAHAVREIARVHGPRAALAGGLEVDARYVSADGVVDLDAIPHDDAATFDAIRSTHTLGMFQIESPGQRELVGKMQPDCFEDLIADISLFRPGPMKGNMVTPFVEAKLGFRQPDYLHPRFRAFLLGSFGVVIYHEHVLRILHECMGVSLAEADEIRRRMEKDMGFLQHAFFKAIAGRRDEQGRRIFSAAQADRIWEVLKGFGSFGFCKAHAAAFALATYQSAWLKTHYPAEFLAGIFEHDPGMYPRRLLMAEARRMGVPILPLDVNESRDEYYVVPHAHEGTPAVHDGLGSAPHAPPTSHPGLVPGSRTQSDTLGIRLSLRDVHGITAAEVKRILAGQPYQSLSDFYLRAAPSRALLIRLAQVGALDCLAPGRGRGDIIAYARRLAAAKSRPANTGQGQLPIVFDDRSLMEAAPAPTPLEQVSAELDVLSAEVSEHVIELYRPLLDELGVVPAADLLGLRSSSEVLVAGIRVATQTPPMRSGKRVVFISLDDGSGCADCTFFEDAQELAGPLLFGTKLLVIAGRTRRTGVRGVSIQAENAWDLKELWNARQRQVSEFVTATT
ncbi:MAG: DNA polymerase III subunit alpha [Propionibacteriaceae bacterium]|jgi:error-prone DNA polymerase|nr:DNA polymerase III subunit alpha [Propionibacteriaceae bacterium]